MRKEDLANLIPTGCTENEKSRKAVNNILDMFAHKVPHKERGILNEPVLLKVTEDWELWRATIDNVLKGYSRHTYTHFCLCMYMYMSKRQR